MGERKTHVRGDRVKRLREQHDFTQGQVELRSGVDRSLISRIERGIRPNVYVETAGALAQALNTTTDYLLGLTANPWPPDNTTEPSTELEWTLLEEFRKLDFDQQRYALAQLQFIVQHMGPHRPRVIGGSGTDDEEGDNET